jgi:hypothetical protein
VGGTAFGVGDYGDCGHAGAIENMEIIPLPHTHDTMEAVLEIFRQRDGRVRHQRVRQVKELHGTAKFG